MRIGLIDVDGHNFPNIPLMKISAYHKASGNTVEWYDPLIGGRIIFRSVSRFEEYAGRAGEKGAKHE